MEKILIVDDELDMLHSFRRLFSNSPDLTIVTASSGEEAVQMIPREKPDLLVMDIRMGGQSGLETLQVIRQLDPKLLVIMMTAYGTTQTAIEAMKLGAFDYVLKPFDPPRIKALIEGALKTARDMRQVVSYSPLLTSEDFSEGIVGKSEAMQMVFKLIGQVSQSDATVMITGESGTGKELVSRAIYHHSRRSDKPFMAINCAAIPDNLLESELFGHERGAFTGAATQRIGKFEQCHLGTLFLDEIGDMALATQTKILRVLQEGEFERVGGNQTIRVNVRIIAATNKNLEEAVRARQFREDLYYRLNVVRIHLPPLRERVADIRVLVDYFLQKLKKNQKSRVSGIAADALAALEKYHWPGNVRELENVIQRAAVIATGEIILLKDLPGEITKVTPETKAAPAVLESPRTMEASQSAPAPAPGSQEPSTLNRLVREMFDWAKQNSSAKLIPAVERELIIHALAETGGNQVRTAKMLGITRATLRKRLEKYQIRRELNIS